MSETRELLKRAWSFITDRLVVLTLIFAVMFCALVARLYDIQIINGKDAVSGAADETSATVKTASVAARRGNIYDRYGRPLAVNETAYIIRIDPTVRSRLSAETALAFINMMDSRGEGGKITITAADFPISRSSPRVFETNGSATREAQWKRDMDLKDDMTAEESYDALSEFFGFAPDVSDGVKWRALSLCATVYMQRYHREQIAIATDVSEGAVAFVEEHADLLPGFYSDVDYLRVYPAGQNFSHMLGYIRAISAEEYETLKDDGYARDSIIGKTGVERAFDRQLRGTEGTTEIRIDESGRRLSSERTGDPVPGDDIYLTIDAGLQNKAAAYLSGMIKTILIEKMKTTTESEKPITPEKLIASMTRGGVISAERILASEDGTFSAKIRDYALGHIETPKESVNYDKNLKNLIADAASNKLVPLGYYLLAMREQGALSLTEQEAENLAKNDYSVRQLLIGKVESGEITPQMANMNPSDGSVVVVDVKTGGILAAASYPTYDNNMMLIQNFSSEYYARLMSDPTSPTWYRAFSSPRAPGSTFKMITATAALESGAITPSTRIIDRGVFTEAGEPYANCWIRTPGFHGSLNVAGALEVSCNYFFYETMYRMGSTKAGDLLDGISTLNRYMSYYGLNDRTGVEISEQYDSMPDDQTKVSSPSYKEYREKERDPGVSGSKVEWNDGDSIRTAIGQSYNDYTAASMAKYVATIAARGTRYQSHLLGASVTAAGAVTLFEPVAEEQVFEGEAVSVSDATFDVIYQGMYAAAQGSRGTARTVFAGFPIKIGAKTGTAQEQNFEHASFAAFAPFDDPQIAVYVVVPYGDTLIIDRPVVQIARDVIGAYFGLDAAPQTRAAENTLMR
ncbi:MAG: hypothetical protein LBK41_00185 [Clostridiales bacterium]|jgi:cell division protein FtsI/penicillin-binding protein 2|nr:hypothetical protein [Clostridiales bacterium]